MIKKYKTKRFGEKLSFKNFIKAYIDFALEKTKIDQKTVAVADINTDEDYAKISSSEDYAQISLSGDYAKIGVSGDLTQISSSGKRVRISSSGYHTQIDSSGDSARISSSEMRTRINSSGDYARINSSGGCAQITASGENSVVCCTGLNSKARAKKGSWITLSEWRFSKEKDNIIPVCVKTEYVDGERIKEDTFYKLVNGEFKEIK